MTTTELEVAVSNAGQLDALDPAAREIAVTGLLDQARHWLATAVEATEPKRISEFKAFIATVAETTKQLNLSREIQLDATEMVRRAERGVGLAVRKGQEEGTVARKGNPYDRTSYSPDEFMRRGTPSMETYAMTDGVSDDQFNDAITKAKEEGNLSRANVVRKIKTKEDELSELSPADRRKKVAELAERGYSSRQITEMLGYSRPDIVREVARQMGFEIPADAVIGRTKKISSNKVVSETIISLEATVMALDLVKPEELDLEQVDYWISSLNASLRSLSKFRNKLKELIHAQA